MIDTYLQTHVAVLRPCPPGGAATDVFQVCEVSLVKISLLFLYWTLVTPLCLL